MDKRHFEDGGAGYAQFRPTYPDSLAETLAAHTPHNDCAVDVGCGSGQFSELLAAHFKTVIASDVSKDQIANAKPHNSITYKVGHAEQIDAANQSADLIVAAQAAHWFDLPAFYKEVERVLKPDGIVALVTYGVFNVDGIAGERIHQFYWKEIHPFWPAGREHVENGYRDFPFPFDPISMPAIAIERTWSIEQFVNYCKTWSAAKRAEAAGRRDIIEAMREDLIVLLGKDGMLNIKWPLTIRAGKI